MPYRPDERQYRDFAVKSFKPEARESSEEQDESYIVRGYFCTFNDPYELFEDYFEEIDPHAFDSCDMSDTIMQVNHDGFVYARIRNQSLSIEFDEHGGHMTADVSGSKRGREELYEAIDNGLIDRMSFGFTIAADGLEWTEDNNGVIHTRITKIDKLYDVSAIAGFPANDGTEISARSVLDGIRDAQKVQAEQAEAEQRAAEEAAEEERAAKEREDKLAMLRLRAKRVSII